MTRKDPARVATRTSPRQMAERTASSHGMPRSNSWWTAVLVWFDRRSAGARLLMIVSASLLLWGGIIVSGIAAWG